MRVEENMRRALLPSTHRQGSQLGLQPPFVCHRKVDYTKMHKCQPFQCTHTKHLHSQFILNV